jgi:hypothetical protein
MKTDLLAMALVAKRLGLPRNVLYDVLCHLHVVNLAHQVSLEIQHLTAVLKVRPFPPSIVVRLGRAYFCKVEVSLCTDGRSASMMALTDSEDTRIVQTHFQFHPSPIRRWWDRFFQPPMCPPYDKHVVTRPSVPSRERLISLLFWPHKKDWLMWDIHYITGRHVRTYSSFFVVVEP